nr:TIM-barrel domain-containing protein [Microbacterium ulmi]
MIWEVWADAADFSIAAAATPLGALSIQAEWAGVAAPPPAWASSGLIAGLQGGTSALREKIATLQAAAAPLSAVWVQDWTGVQDAGTGVRPRANWTLDAQRYAGWDELVAELAGQGIRVLTYVAPWLSADAGAAAAGRGDRDLYAEAADAGYLARDDDGAVLATDQGGVTVASVDLSNPEAREWLAQVIAAQVAGVGASGWMADAGEGPPPEARLQGGVGIDWRVRWPVLWQQVNARALEISGLGAEGFVWHRSGGTDSAGAADAVWLGDQTQDWSAEDGLRSALSLTQSLSASGVAQVHGDIGGSTSIDLPIVGDVARDDELVVRWAEASLLQPVFRTTEGTRPDAAAQPAEDSRLARQIAKLARLFAALGPERARLAAQGPLRTAPQHPWILNPAERLLSTGSADDELQLGADIVLAPVVERGAEAVAATLPPGRWKHVWSGAMYGSEAGVSQALVGAEPGEPALFVRDGSPVADELSAYVAAEKALEAGG